mgnify:FL=1
MQICEILSVPPAQSAAKYHDAGIPWPTSNKHLLVLIKLSNSAESRMFCCTEAYLLMVVSVIICRNACHNSLPNSCCSVLCPCIFVNLFAPSPIVNPGGFHKLHNLVTSFSTIPRFCSKRTNIASSVFF